VQGIDGRICARSSGVEGGKDSAEIALEMGGLSLRDRHPFADASFANLLGSHDGGSGGGSGGGGGGSGSGGSSSSSSSLLSLSLRREATREGVWTGRGYLLLHCHKLMHLLDILHNTRKPKQTENATEVDVGLRPLRLQWNPETVLALQRFFSFHTRPQQLHQPTPSPQKQPRWQHPAAEEDAAAAGGGGGLVSSFMSPMSASLYFASNDGSVIMALPPGASAAAAAAATAPRRASRFRLTATLEAVEVLLNKEGELRRLLGLNIASAALSFEAAVGGTKQLVGTITGLVVTDLGNVDTCFPRVLGTAEGEDDAALVVQFKYTSTGAAPADPSQSKAAASSSQPQFAETATAAAATAAAAAKAVAPVRADNLLEVEVGPLQVVYFNHLSLEVIDYLCEGVLAAAVTGALRSADALVRQRALAKTGFSIRMARPRCLLPRLLVRPALG
jgi:hypothetical protein